jgi:hypothetical protein
VSKYLAEEISEGCNEFERKLEDARRVGLLWLGLIVSAPESEDGQLQEGAAKKVIEDLDQVFDRLNEIARLDEVGGE